MYLKLQSHQAPGLGRTGPDLSGEKSGLGPGKSGAVLLSPAQSCSVLLGPAWSLAVRVIGPAVLKCLKLPGQSGKVFQSGFIRDSPGMGPGRSGTVRSSSWAVLGIPAFKADGRAVCSIHSAGHNIPQ